MRSWFWIGMAIVAVSVFSTPLNAQIDWDANGGTGGDLSNPLNWVGNQLPLLIDLARIDSNTSSGNPASLASGLFEIDNIDLGPTTASYLTVNGGRLMVYGTQEIDFKIGVGASAQSVFTLNSGTVEFGEAGSYTDGNDFDIGKNGNGRYVQTGGTFKHHADDFKIADSAGGTGVADISGGYLWVADGFSISDSAGGTGTMNLSGTAEVVSGNSDGLGGFLGTLAGGYISIANGGGTGALNITDNASMHGRYLEYRGEPGASAMVTVGGNGKLVLSEEIITLTPGTGSAQNVMGSEEGTAGQILVQESGLFAVDNPTEQQYSDGYVIGRTGGSGSLSVEGTNARIVVRQRILLGSGNSDIDFDAGSPGAATPGTGSLTIGTGGHVVTSELHIGTTGVGTVTQTGGTMVIKNSDPLYGEAGFENGTKGEDIFIGSLQGSTGTYDHSGGSVSAGDDFIIGDWGTGTYNMSGTASVDGVGWTVLGNEIGSSGTWNMSGGEFNQDFGDLEIGDAGIGVLSLSGGTINVSGYTAVGHREGNGEMNISGTAVLNTPNLKILMGKDGLNTQRGVLTISGKDAQINVAETFTMDESNLGNENKIVANLTADGIGTIHVGSTASIERGSLEVVSDPGIYKPKGGDQYVLIDAAGGWSGADDFASVSFDVTLNNPDNEFLMYGTGFSGAGGSANTYEIRIIARGDFNTDLEVDSSDLSVWATHFGSLSGTYAEGDANEDTVIDGSDFLLWQRNVHVSADSAAGGLAVTAVPEPGGAWILLILLVVRLVPRLRRS